MRKIVWLITTWIFAPVLVLAQELSLDSCYVWTHANYPTLKNKALNIEANQLRIKNLRSNFLPTIQLNAQAHYQSDVTHMDMGANPAFSTMSVPKPPLKQFKITVDVQQVIYDGGITQKLKSVEQQNLLTKNQQIEVDLYQLDAQVNDLFFTILMLKKNSEQLGVMKESLEKTLTSVASGVKNGMLLPGSDDDLQVSLYELEQQQTQLDKGIDAAFAILNELTGKNFTKTQTISLPEIAEKEEVKRPELKLFGMQKNNLAQLSQVSKAKRLPTLGAFAQLGYANPALNMLKDEWKEFLIVGARLHWNIHDWGNSKRERQEYAVQQAQLDNLTSAFLRNIQIAKTKEIEKQNELKAVIVNDAKIIALRARIRKRSESQLANGVITSSEYIKKLTAETQAKIKREIHELELLRSKVNLSFIVGK